MRNIARKNMLRRDVLSHMTVKELDDRYETCLRQSREFQTKMKDAGNENIMVNDVEPADKSRTQRHDNFCDPMALMM